MAAMNNHHNGNKNVLVLAVDNSEACLKAVTFALDNFPGWSMHLLHVQTKPLATSMLVSNADAAGLAFAGQDVVEEERMENTVGFMDKIFIPKASANGNPVQATVLKSDPDTASGVGQAICAFVEKHHPAALVIMRENKGAVTRFFMGSVSRYCAVHSAVPVIVVPSS